MNRSILILSLVLAMSLNQANAQSWAPDGAEWHYEYANFWYEGYVHITVVGDTIIHDTACRILDRTSTIHNHLNGTTNTFNYGLSYMYSDEDKVYLFENNKFYAIYDFSALPGDTIVIPQNSSLPQVGCAPEGEIVVTDTATVFINGKKLRKISVLYTEESNWALYGDIIETIGPENSYMLPEPNWCVIDLYEGGALRCYSDPEFGIYDTGLAPECDFLVSVKELSRKSIKIFPNPSEGMLHIEIQDDISGLQYSIINSGGQEVHQGFLQEKDNTINLTHLPSGVYALKANLNNQQLSKLILLK